jgi:hypothetical protein
MRASSTDRALICPASLVRKQTGKRSAQANKTAEWGTFVHSWKETGEVRGNKTLTKKLQRSGIDREKLWPKTSDSHGHEATFSINIESLQLRIWSPKGSNYQRDHWKRRHPRHSYITGSIDWLSTRSRDGLPWVDDLKTGTWPVHAKYSKQLRTYALVPWILSGCTTDVWLSVTQWPKYRLDCKPKRNWHLIKSNDLAKHLVKIKWAMKNTHLAIPSTEGCRFCLCKPDCNEYQESEYNV